ncbi:MAG: error-prone DNA polymerase [Thermomicrobiales bacterium]
MTPEATSTPTPTYAELHLHTAYSLLDGAALPEELAARAAELGYRHLAVTDHDGLYGAREFAQAMQAVGIAPITGAELTLLDGSHLTLLVESAKGYANLCQLISAAHAPEAGSEWPTEPTERTPRLDPALLADHAAGLVLLTGCPRGQLSRAVDAGDLPGAAALLRQYVEWFGADNVYVELQQNQVRGDTARLARLARLAAAAGLPTVATGNVHYHRPERSRLHDVLVAIRHNGTLDATARHHRRNGAFALRPMDEVARLFARYPEAVRASLHLAERCAAFNLAGHTPYQFPQNLTPEGETLDSYLTRVCHEKFAARYPPDHPRRETAWARLNEELDLIAKQRLAAFFLQHLDLMELAEEVAQRVRQEQGQPAASPLPPGRGRGSSVNSLVCYLIGLSPVDPLEHRLSLGRFLNDGRTEPPDIDLDFPRKIREQLMLGVYERYPGRVGLICTFATYKLRSAVRDIGKALGIPIADLDRIAKLCVPGSARILREELMRMPEYAARLETPPWSLLIELAGELSGFPRHISQHSGGMVIAACPITDLVPLQPAAMQGRWLIQWDKDSVADAGMIKLDFLALGMLELVEECVQGIASRYPEENVDLTRIDYDDTAVFDMICAGDTVGTFQIESRAQIQTLLKTQPRSLDDLTVQVAIVRPGPIVGGATSPYIQRRLDPHFQPTYDHPLLEPVLADTMGVVLYQDQVIEVAQALAGFTAGQADQLRRAMTRKRSQEAITSLWTQFRDGALAKGVPLETSENVFRKLLGFAAYGFPRGHAASFAVLAYQSCWLKQRYPAEFLCALLNNQPMGFYSQSVLANEAKRRGVRTLLPDINQSGVRCIVQDARTVQLGLSQVQGLGEDAARAIVTERAANGSYVSVPDLLRRVSLPVPLVESMALAGLFDSFGLARREAAWQAGLGTPVRALPAGRAKTRDRGQQLALELPVAQDMVTLPPMPVWERLAAETLGLGLSPHWHPLGVLRQRLPGGIRPTADTAHLRDGLRIQVAGLVVVRQRPETARGVTFLLLEDEQGLLNVIVPPPLYEAERHIVRGEPFVVVEGILQRKLNTINLLAERIWPLAEARSQFPARTTPAGLNHPEGHRSADRSSDRAEPGVRMVEPRGTKSFR